MKYFTKKWWVSGGETTDLVDEYNSYIKSVKKSLPDGVCQILDEHTLHDALIIHISVNLENRDVHLKFTGWDNKFENRVNYMIGLRDVGIIDIVSPDGINATSGIDFGDVGYYEFEVLQEGIIELRMIFSSYVELTVEFKSLDLQCSNLD